MPRARLASGIELEYETLGSPDDEALLLIAGLGRQLLAWEDGFCDRLVSAGRFVIRFDNRDAGLSSQMDGEVDVVAVAAAALAGLPVPEVPYLLGDMARDAVGLLDHLGLERVHVVGKSMGGMIAQTIAIEHPHRCRSLVSIASQPGEPDVGQPTPEAMAVLIAPLPGDRAAYLEACATHRIWRSRRYGDVDRIVREASREFDRASTPDGTVRQFAAIFASGRRSAQLAELAVPTLVIHGRDDTLIHPSGGFRTAELIPGANLLFVGDMGHDLPEELWPILTDAIISHTRHARAG